MVTLPHKLKYYTLSVGASTQVKTDDLQVPVYQLTNNDTNVVESENINFPEAFRTALARDRMMERVVQYEANHEPFDHLEEEEEEPGAGIMVPTYLAGGGGSQGGGGLH